MDLEKELDEELTKMDQLKTKVIKKIDSIHSITTVILIALFVITE